MPIENPHGTLTKEARGQEVNWSGKYSDSEEEIRARLEGIQTRTLRSDVYDQLLLVSLQHARVLEIGCGTGQHSVALALARPDWDITATDFAETAVAETMALAQAAHVRIATTRMDVTNLAFPDESLDIVFGDNVIAHIPDLEKALGEIYRVLKPDGIFIANVSNSLRPDAWPLFFLLTKKTYFSRSFFPWELTSIIRKSRLSPQSSFGTEVFLDRGLRLLFKKVSLRKPSAPTLSPNGSHSMDGTPSSAPDGKEGFRKIKRWIATWLPTFLRVQYGVVAKKSAGK